MHVDPQLIERWFAIKSMLWDGKMVEPGDEVDPGQCNMIAKVRVGEVLGCKKGQHVEVDEISTVWRVVDDKAPETQVVDPPHRPEIAQTTEPVESQEPGATPLPPAPSQDDEPEFVEAELVEPESDPAVEPEPEPADGEPEPLFAPVKRVKKKLTKKRIKKTE